MGIGAFSPDHRAALLVPPGRKPRALHGCVNRNSMFDVTHTELNGALMVGQTPASLAAVASG